MVSNVKESPPLCHFDDERSEEVESAFLDSRKADSSRDKAALRHDNLVSGFIGDRVTASAILNMQFLARAISG